MKKSDLEDDVWQTVPRKRSGKAHTSTFTKDKPAKGIMISSQFDMIVTDEDADKILEQVKHSKQCVKNSAYFNFVSRSIAVHLPSQQFFDSIIALGIGSLVSPVSQLQLAIYLCLCDLHLSSTTSINEKCIFDPIITSLDRKIYDDLGIPVLTQNTKGKHEVTKGKKVLFFLPHCPYRLYCNILWANWDNMENIYLYGNSFESYGTRRMQSNNSIVQHKSASAAKKHRNKQSPTENTKLITIDPTDTIALLSPYFEEINLWPTTSSSTGYINNNDGNNNSTDMNITTVNSTTSDSNTTTAITRIDMNRTTFIKEGNKVPLLRHIENAVCDMSFMYWKGGIEKDILSTLKPSEELIDQASLNDAELF